MDNKLERSNKIITAEYCRTVVPAYKDNPFIRALGPSLSPEEARTKLRRKPAYNPRCVKASAIDRIHMAEDILGLVLPFEENVLFEQIFGLLVRQGYRGRYGADFWTKIYQIDEVTTQMLKIASAGQIVGSTPSGLIIGETGNGKTTMLRGSLDQYLNGVYNHTRFQGKKLDCLQVPFLPIECPPDGSMAAFLELLLDNLGHLVGTDLFKGTSRKSAAKLIPILVKALLKYSVGMVIVDEAQNIVSQFSGGDTKLLYFWINLMNTAGVPILLLANPEILKITGTFMKAGMRFSSGGELRLHPMPRYGKWEVLMNALEKYWYLRVPGTLTTKIRDQYWVHTAGNPRATLGLHRYVMRQAINEGIEFDRPELLSPGLVQRAAETYTKSLQKGVEAIHLNTAKSRGAFKDLWPEPVLMETVAGEIETPATPEPEAVDRTDTTPGAIPPPKAKRGPKRGKKKAVIPSDYLDEAVRDKLSVHAAMLQDTLVKFSTEFMILSS